MGKAILIYLKDTIEEASLGTTLSYAEHIPRMPGIGLRLCKVYVPRTLQGKDIEDNSRNHETFFYE